MPPPLMAFVCVFGIVGLFVLDRDKGLDLPRRCGSLWPGCSSTAHALLPYGCKHSDCGNSRWHGLRTFTSKEVP